MATNPLIALQGSNVVPTFSNVLTNLSNIQQQEITAEQAPARQKLLESQADIASKQVPSDIQTFTEQDRIFAKSVADISRQIIPDLETGNVDVAIQKLQNRAVKLKAAGMDTSNTEKAIALAQSNPQELLRGSINAVAVDDRLSGAGKTGLASAKTEILESGATIQSLPSGQVVVKNAAGEQVEGQERSDVLKHAAQVKQDRLQQQAGRTVETARKIEQVKKATVTADKAFGLVDNIRSNIANLNEVVKLVGEGADTGPISQFFPSFRAASVKLDQLQNRLGLDVVGATTFGALSKGELDLAKDVALPKALQGPELIKWVNVRVAAQTKLANYYEEQAIFLGQGNSQSDWLKFKKKELKDLFNVTGATPDNIKQTMKDNNMTRSEVIQELKRRSAGGR